MIAYIDGVDGPQGGRPPGEEGSSFALHCTTENIMSAQKLTNLVDTIAMTLVTAALLAALPVSAILFVTSSI